MLHLSIIFFLEKGVALRNSFNIKLFAFLVIAILVILQSFAYSIDTEHVTIVDTDMGLDDVRAILSLLAA